MKLRMLRYMYNVYLFITIIFRIKVVSFKNYIGYGFFEKVFVFLKGIRKFGLVAFSAKYFENMFSFVTY